MCGVGVLAKAHGVPEVDDPTEEAGLQGVEEESELGLRTQLSLFFVGIIATMLEPEASRLSAMEEELKKRFDKKEADKRKLPSTAAPAAPSVRIDQLVLPDEMRAKMPFTKDKFLIRENPHLVQWEREVRKFCRNLSPDHGHRISAAMIYEWATGIRVADAAAMTTGPLEPGKQNYKSDLRKINRLLEYYFGKPYKTWIMGRQVPRAYRVRPGYYIRRHRPRTLTLYAEYVEGVLYP